MQENVNTKQTQDELTQEEAITIVELVLGQDNPEQAKQLTRLLYFASGAEGAEQHWIISAAAHHAFTYTEEFRQAFNELVGYEVAEVFDDKNETER